MTEDDLDFTLESDELGAERVELLDQAAKALVERGGHLGAGKQRATAESDVAMEFNEDRAKLSLPEVVDLDLGHLHTDAQVERDAILTRWRFYWVKFPLDLWTRPGWGFNQLQFKAEFNPDDEERARPRVHDAVPTQEYATLATAKLNLDVGLGANFKFAAEAPPLPLHAAGLPVEVEAALQAVVGGDTGFALTPRPYQVRVPVVKRSNVDLDSIRWRLEGGRIIDEKDPGLRVVLKVPHGTRQLHISAAMRARRNWNSFDSDLQGAFGSLKERFQAFFQRGAPISDWRTWDLSASLNEKSGG